MRRILAVTAAAARAVASASAAGALLTACGPDAAAPAPASEHGAWSVLAARRDGRPIGTLDAAYFAFDTGAAELRTNLLSEEVTLRYRREGEAIVTDGPSELARFGVRELTDSVLVLTARIRGSAFDLELVPAGGQVRED